MFILQNIDFQCLLRCGRHYNPAARREQGEQRREGLQLHGHQRGLHGRHRRQGQGRRQPHGRAEGEPAEAAAPAEETLPCCKDTGPPRHQPRHQPQRHGGPVGADKGMPVLRRHG